MTLFSRFFAPKKAGNIVTTLERQRLNRSMPGQTGALAGARLGFLVR